MNSDSIIERLRDARAALQQRGVTHAALFGSIARGEGHPGSDIDILVDLDPAVVRTLFDYAGVKDCIAKLFDGPVDVVDREGLKPHVRPSATAEAIDAF
jgi:predicted nucleotidyltransferase